MFGKLFGKKKSTKPQTLEDAKKTLIENISEESFNKHVGTNFNDCMEFLVDAPAGELDDFANSIFKLVETLPLGQSILAMSICSNLIQRGYDNEKFVGRVIDFYAQALEAAMPFFRRLDEEVKMGESGDAEIDVDVDSLYYELLKDRNIVSEKVGESVTRIERSSMDIVAILSMSSSTIFEFKSKLKDNIFFVRDYIQGCYWMYRLFEVLFEEPIIVIDVDNHRGFEAVMNGVSDNFQLQHLLMGMTELNDQPAISESDLSVANGTGIHVSNSMIDGKWNMYNREIVDQEDWQDIKVGPAKTMELQDFWIWGEGTPSEISAHNGKRVILLGRSSYKRTARLQRTFENMKASIEVKHILTEDEINEWLGL